MTINEAVAEIDAVKPNMYGLQDKVRWLSRLDGRIEQEIISAHELNEGEEPPVFDGYTPDTSGDTELLVPAPYDELYIRWLEAQIDYANREFDSFNASNAMFESVYTAFRNAYNRTHMPKGARRVYY